MKLSELSIVRTDDQSLFDRCNATERNWDLERSVVDLFEKQAVATPHAPAFIGSGSSLTYREMEERANRMAHCLIAAGVGPEMPVALYVERVDAFVLAMLAVFKAGACYVPIDPEYPAAYMEQVLSDARP